MHSLYVAKTDNQGEDHNVGEDPNPTRRPFKAILDVGLVNTTTGNKVFGVMKGACDGGLYVPHSANKFPGNVKDGEN
jgi:large subunit ribosomal protein L5e